jgi:two-component system, NtrC family, sensor histidine kinase HupT/HoxJ
MARFVPPPSAKPAAARSDLARPELPKPGSNPEGVDDATWMDVIQKMDEVYTKLIDDEIALEQKNAELEQSHQFIFSVLSAMSDFVVACSEGGQIEETNGALRELVGRDDDALVGTPIVKLFAAEGDAELARQMMTRAAAQRTRLGETVELHLHDRSGGAVPVEFTARLASTARASARVLCSWAGPSANCAAPTSSCRRRTRR